MHHCPAAWENPTWRRSRPTQKVLTMQSDEEGPFVAAGQDRCCEGRAARAVMVKSASVPISYQTYLQTMNFTNCNAAEFQAWAF